MNVQSNSDTPVPLDTARLREIERHLQDATPGTHVRDCGGRLFAQVDGEEVQIGEAYSVGDARLWRHAATDIRWLLAEVARLARLASGQSALS